MAALRAPSIIRTWRSAPEATSVTAPAISPTARPASSEVVAICWEAALTSPAELATGRSASARPSVMRVNEAPRRSCSPRTVTAAVRSPSATRSKAAASSRSDPVISPNAPASWASSSLPSAATCWSTSPRRSPSRHRAGGADGAPRRARTGRDQPGQHDAGDDRDDARRPSRYAPPTSPAAGARAAPGRVAGDRQLRLQRHAHGGVGHRPAPSAPRRGRRGRPREQLPA